MLIGFLDDTELIIDKEDSEPDIFAFGGFFIQQERLFDLQQRIEAVKWNHHLPWYAPLKWNMKDASLREFYTEANLLLPEQREQALQVSKSLRCELLSLLTEFEATILISARYDKHWQDVPNSQYFEWAFENLLQRVGLMAKMLDTQSCATSATMLVVDWPQNGVGKKLFSVYAGGYHHGMRLVSHQHYHSGHLKNHRFADSLVHGSTLHSGPLQLADMVVGCCRDFLAWAYTGQKIQKIQGTFDLLIDRFYRDERGRLNNCGFKIAKGDPIDIEVKIEEYKRIQNPEPYSELPF